MKRKRRFSVKKNLLPALLAAAMVFANISGDLSAVWAAQAETVEFEIWGSDLANAVREAVESGSPVTRDDLDFTDGATDRFESLFFDTGKVYEVYPSVDGGDPEGDVRIFVRLPEDADDTYELTGDEEVIFLYINNGEETLRFTTSVLRTVDGNEKVKRTGRVSVRAYEDVFGEVGSSDSVQSADKAVQTQVKDQDAAGENQSGSGTVAGDETETGSGEVTGTDKESGVQVPDQTKDEISAAEDQKDPAGEQETEESGEYTEKSEAAEETGETEEAGEGSETEKTGDEAGSGKTETADEEDETESEKSETADKEDETESEKSETADKEDETESGEFEAAEQEGGSEAGESEAAAGEDQSEDTEGDKTEDDSQEMGAQSEGLSAAVSRHDVPVVAAGLETEVSGDIEDRDETEGEAEKKADIEDQDGTETEVSGETENEAGTENIKETETEKETEEEKEAEETSEAAETEETEKESGEAAESKADDSAETEAASETAEESKAGTEAVTET